jgi:probable phosphoglycerate mutase
MTWFPPVRECAGRVYRRSLVRAHARNPQQGTTVSAYSIRDEFRERGREERVLRAHRVPRDHRAMLELYLVRHGQTDFSRENRFCGSIDPPLNDIGLEMADAFGEHYAAENWEAIYASPSLRARQTAEALSRRIGKELKIEEGLREIGYGEWESLRHEDVQKQWPEAYAYWSADVASRGTPGGETAFHVAARAAPVLERIRRYHSDGKVLIVSHKATIRILVCALLGMDVRLFRDRISQPVAAVTRFEIGKRGALLTALGDVTHLPMSLRRLEGT